TTGIHGIRDEDVRGEPDFAARAPALAELARGAVIIAHNAPFDLAFLRAELERAGLPAALNEVLDTRILAKAAYPGLQSYKLVDLARFLGIDTGRSHRALDDAKTCAALFLAAARRLEPEPEAAAEA
ncbi:MAG: 3'-5' exonuclease, partial [Spirochaetaceae bacterium]|nr:3'-5' exonuclease [Spirochaetaceae bacterium]